MDGRELSNRLSALQPPPGALERTRRELSDELASDRGRDRRRLAALLVAILAGISVFSQTAPGQATVDWVADVFSVNGGENGERFVRNQEVVANGELSDGSTYSVTVAGLGDRACPGFLLNESAVKPGSARGTLGCSAGAAESGLGRFSYVQLRNGAVVAYGVANSEVERVTIAYAGGESEADVIPLRGTVVQADGSEQPIEPIAVVVAELPPGIGDATQQSTARATAIDADGVELGSEPLQWVQRRIGGVTTLLDCEVAPVGCGKGRR